MQGVIKSYDPQSKTGVVVDDVDRDEHDLALDALEGSIFRMVRQGQRVVFDLNEQGLATQLRLGSEVDLGTPDWITAAGDDAMSALRWMWWGDTCGMVAVAFKRGNAPEKQRPPPSRRRRPVRRQVARTRSTEARP